MTNLTLKEKIRKSRREKDLSQSKISDMIGVSLRTFQRFEDGKAEPDINQLREIANITGKNLSYFLNEPELEIKNFTDEQLPVQKVPLISWVSANRFGEASDPFPPGVADDWVYTTARGKRMFALKVKHDCMEPEFREGERIIVNPDIYPNSGDYVVVRDNQNNEATFKQFKKYGKKIILHPLNPKYQDIDLEHNQRYVIVGKVVGKDKQY